MIPLIIQILHSRGESSRWLLLQELPIRGLYPWRTVNLCSNSGSRNEVLLSDKRTRYWTGRTARKTSCVCRRDAAQVRLIIITSDDVPLVEVQSNVLRYTKLSISVLALQRGYALFPAMRCLCSIF